MSLRVVATLIFTSTTSGNGSPKHYERIRNVIYDLVSLQSGRDVPKSPVTSFSYDRKIERIRVQLVLLDLSNSVTGIQFSGQTWLFSWDSTVT